MATKSKLRTLTLDKALPYILVIAGIIGLICSFVITYEKLQLLANPAYQPNCNLNPIISCGSVMASDQANVFGFPNPIIGLSAFAGLLTVGLVLLAGAKFKRWFWICLQIGTIFGLFFVHWLAFQTTFRIGALCPYCIVVWIVTITSFWYVLMYNLDHRYLTLPGRVGGQVSTFILRHHIDILLVWFLIIAIVILKHFWYYFGRNL
jgi:uncharacterized membrane protein